MTGTQKRILVIEDEKPLAHALELKLSHKGFTVSTASNGEQGLMILENETYDLILCDLIMPKVDGFKVLESLKEKKIKTPIIILTNLSQGDDEKKARALGAVDFFIKSNTPITKIVELVIKRFDISL